MGCTTRCIRVMFARPQEWQAAAGGLPSLPALLLFLVSIKPMVGVPQSRPVAILSSVGILGVARVDLELAVIDNRQGTRILDAIRAAHFKQAMVDDPAHLEASSPVCNHGGWNRGKRDAL